MKFSFVRNDKSTVADEIILGLFIIFFVTAGVLLFAYHPSFWIIDINDTKVFGVLMIFIGMMFLPGLVYRLFTNDKK